ncbi:hypothetical protein T281_00700 [Rhodomicrobium udaipurense JA643]|uniref:Uncharacterized protein n=1 Tax=Rhodomicrobium udaipurense TaxID=1202716 RepID=A0A8I1GDG9_9HYPH|nr:hypothetical protein [Rhodomicrobium udaipurense]KAI96360.1 hypothetical protein T281_00700 [Rhodomicrobium udaipurense JA643]MBJ7542468.1 hypothetical protein [Rhodomicrobium udaipurense]
MLRSVLGVLLIACTAALAGGGFYAAASLKADLIDPATLCPRNGATSATLVLIDRTDPLTPVEQSFAKDLIAAQRDAAARGERIAVKVLRERERGLGVALETLVDLCNPGAGAEVNPFFENPKRIAVRYESAFLQPVEDALAALENEGTATASPIAEALALGVQSLDVQPEGLLKVILISDMMEHGPGASAYNGTLTSAALTERLLPEVRPALSAARTKVVLLPRPRFAKQQASALKVWRRLFLELSGRDPDLMQPFDSGA